MEKKKCKLDGLEGYKCTQEYEYTCKGYCPRHYPVKMKLFRTGKYDKFGDVPDELLSQEAIFGRRRVKMDVEKRGFIENCRKLGKTRAEVSPLFREKFNVEQSSVMSWFARLKYPIQRGDKKRELMKFLGNGQKMEGHKLRDIAAEKFGYSPLYVKDILVEMGYSFRRGLRSKLKVGRSQIVEMKSGARVFSEIRDFEKAKRDKEMITLIKGIHPLIKRKLEETLSVIKNLRILFKLYLFLFYSSSFYYSFFSLKL